MKNLLVLSTVVFPAIALLAAGTSTVTQSNSTSYTGGSSTSSSQTGGSSTSQTGGSSTSQTGGSSSSQTGGSSNSQNDSNSNSQNGGSSWSSNFGWTSTDGWTSSGNQSDWGNWQGNSNTQGGGNDNQFGGNGNMQGGGNGNQPGGNGNMQGGGNGNQPGGNGNWNGQPGGGDQPGGNGQQGGGTGGMGGGMVFDTFMTDSSAVGFDVRSGVWISTDQATTKIVSGTNLTQMAVGAAAGMSKLVTVDLRSSTGLKQIPSCAFAGCVSLKSVVLPTSVTSIADDAFIGCDQLVSVTVESASTDDSDGDDSGTSDDSGSSDDSGTSGGSGSSDDSGNTDDSGTSDQDAEEEVSTAVEDSTATTAMVVTKAQTYYGYTYDSFGISGTATIKTSKANTRTGLVTVKVTLWPFGGKKQTVSTKVTVNVDEPTVATFSNVEGLTLTISGSGITGSCAYGTLVASRDFSAMSTDVRAAEYNRWIGGHTGVFATTGAEGDAAAFAGGYTTFSVRLARKGVAKIAGNMGDGTSFSQTTRAQLSADGSTARIPVLARLYRGKTGGFGFVLALETNGTARVESVANWDASSRTAGSFVASLAFVTNGVPTKISKDGGTLTVPALEGSTLVSMSLSSNASTGILRGTYRVILPNDTKRTSVTLRGVSAGGRGYATSVIKKQGTYATEVIPISE